MSENKVKWSPYPQERPINGIVLMVTSMFI